MTANKDLGKKEHVRTENRKVDGEAVKRPRKGRYGMAATSEMGPTRGGWNLL